MVLGSWFQAFLKHLDTRQTKGVKMYKKVLSKKEKCLSDEDARNAGGGDRLEERGEIMQIGENVIYN